MHIETPHLHLVAHHPDSSLLDRLAGIDFGTSNSSVGLFRNASAELLNVAGEGCSVPSAIFYSTENPEVSFGKQAVENYTQGTEGRLLRSLKSVLGTALMNEKTLIRNKRVAFSDIIEDFFRYLKHQLDAQRHTDVHSVVLGRPVHFVDDDEARDRTAEKQLRDIAASAGFQHIEFQFEPIAAALNYESSLTREELVVIVDIGGGTADFSVLRLSPKRHTDKERADDVLGNMGVHIGGTDFDRLLSLHSVMPVMGFGSAVKSSGRTLPGSVFFDLATWHRIPLLYNVKVWNQVQQMRLDAAQPDRLDTLLSVIEHRLGHALARSVESGKILLSDQQRAAIKLDYRANSLVECAVSRDDMEEAISAAVISLCDCVETGLKQAGVQASDITSVFYTGGSSSVPCLQSAFEALLPAATHKRGDVFGSVGLGLALDAARRFA